MLVRLTLLSLALALVLAGCGSSARSGPRGLPPLAPQDDWAGQRVEAVLDLYSFTDGGEEAIRRMRVLHMLGRPGWFGSTGYQNFVGIGTSRPSSIVHELSHTFWGAFPVEGRPELSFTAPSPQELSTGITALRRDLDIFMQQPPDLYEPLRARFRLIPDLIIGGLPGLYHLGEADIVHFTGANLNLVPPILRKYYSPWLGPGRFESWDEAIQWYLSLPPEERRLADAFTGVGRMPHEGYRVEVEQDAKVGPMLSGIVKAEDRQRLVDFVEQFDLYFKAVDGEPVTNDFRFWRGYLRDMAGLSRNYPDVIGGESAPTAQIRNALRFLLDVEALPSVERAAFVRSRLLEDRALLGFVTALDHRTLADLLSAGDTDVERRVGALVLGVLEPDHALYLARASEVLDAEGNAREADKAFATFINGLEDRQLGQMNFILELFGVVDREGTRRLLKGLPPETALLVLKKGPAYVRFLLEPEELITVLGFDGELTQERLVQLAGIINDYVAGPRATDELFLNAAYRRIVERGEESPADALAVFSESGLLVEPFLVGFPEAAAALVSAEPAVAAQVFREANPVRLPPARAIYRLVQADPLVAARLTLEYDRLGNSETVQQAIMFFAYDAQRLRSQPELSKISIENDGSFLAELVEVKGEAWLRDRLTAFRESYEVRLQAGEADPGFLDAFKETVAEGIADLPDGQREPIERVVAAGLG